MKFRIALLALVSLVIISSCKKKTHCGAYNDVDVDEWFPFTEGNQLVYWNANLVTPIADTFSILQVKKSDAYISEDQDLGGSKGDCNTAYTAFSKETNQDDNSKPILYFNFETVKKYDVDTVIKTGQIKMFKNTIIDFGAVDFFKIHPSSTSPYNYTFTHFDSLIAPDMNVYYNIYEIAINLSSLSNVDVDKIYVAKEKGIVGYRKYPSGVYFTKYNP